MKSFEDFENYMRTNGQQIHDEIFESVSKSVEKASIEDKGEEFEFYRRAWVEIGCMKILKHYHEWLNKS